MPINRNYRKSSPPQQQPGGPSISRRQLLAGVSGSAAALLIERRNADAQTPTIGTVVFSHTTVVNADDVHNDVAVAIQGDRIAAIGPTDQILQAYRNSDVY